MWITVTAINNTEIAINTANVIYMKPAQSGTQIFFSFNGPSPKGDEIVRSVTVKSSLSELLARIETGPAHPPKKKTVLRLLGI